jgi:phage-related holin
MFENILQHLGAWFVELWNLGGVKAIVAQTIFNVVLALAAAVHTDTFNLKKLGEFLYKKLLPFLTVYVVAKAVGVVADIEWVSPITYAAIAAMLAGDMVENLMKLGLPIPDFVQRFLRTENAAKLARNVKGDYSAGQYGK